MVNEFFRVTLNKIVIAKIFGIPLLIADLMFNIFSYFQAHIIVKVLVLIAMIYLMACFIDYFKFRKK